MDCLAGFFSLQLTKLFANFSNVEVALGNLKYVEIRKKKKGEISWNNIWTMKYSDRVVCVLCTKIMGSFPPPKGK